MYALITLKDIIFINEKNHYVFHVKQHYSMNIFKRREKRENFVSETKIDIQQINKIIYTLEKLYYLPVFILVEINSYTLEYYNSAILYHSSNTSLSNLSSGAKMQSINANKIQCG